MSRPPVLLWLRRDLRLDDHPAWMAALESGPVIPVFILEDDPGDPWLPGAASRWWLHHALDDLDSQLRARGSRLVLAQGNPREVLRSLVRTTGARTLVWTRRYDPAGVSRDTDIKAALESDGLRVDSCPGFLLYEPWEIRTGGDTPYKVFTPFWRALLTRGDPGRPLAFPRDLTSPRKFPASLKLDELALLPDLDWAREFPAAGAPGPSGARELTSCFRPKAQDYETNRDRIDFDGTSRLGAHLAWGCVSPRRLWHRIDEPSFRRQLAWREFAWSVLWHNPDLPVSPWRKEFKKFPWRRSQRDLKRWQQGQTGYPLVDAGMRELWATGRMHNRARMVVGSFLTKHLRLDWTEGARWFWNTLIDADLANNSFGWQWIAGCGADAAPYFRVFNPITQSKKFDPEGKYIARWVPELSDLEPRLRHTPWKEPLLAPEYPKPMVDHAQARKAALDAWGSIRD